jgi:hypothetical protein
MMGFSIGVIPVNHRPSINVFQNNDFQFHCFPKIISKLSSCGFMPTGVISFACGWISLEEYWVDVWDNQFFCCTTISPPSFAARVIYFANGLANRAATVGIVLFVGWDVGIV